MGSWGLDIFEPNGKTSHFCPTLFGQLVLEYFSPIILYHARFSFRCIYAFLALKPEHLPSFPKHKNWSELNRRSGKFARSDSNDSGSSTSVFSWFN